jgi:hypothetical protein
MRVSVSGRVLSSGAPFATDFFMVDRQRVAAEAREAFPDEAANGQRG